MVYRFPKASEGFFNQGASCSYKDMEVAVVFLRKIVDSCTTDYSDRVRLGRVVVYLEREVQRRVKKASRRKLRQLGFKIP